jgi:hypothetical protein
MRVTVDISEDLKVVEEEYRRVEGSRMRTAVPPQKYLKET